MAAASRQARRNRGAQERAPGWVWLVVGLSIGLFVALLVHLRARAPAPPAPQDAAAVEAPSPVPKPRFEFYTILPEREVRVADRELRAPASPPKPAVAARTAESGAAQARDESFLLQVGSFRKYQEADRLKAKLALLGLEAEIQTVAAERGESWHRVRLGPFTDRRLLQRTREQLRRNQLDALVMRTRG